MRTDAEIEAFFAELEPRRAAIARRYRAGLPFTLSGFGIGCLGPLVAIGLLAEFHRQWSTHPRRAAILAAAVAAALVCVGIGAALHRLAGRIGTPIDAAADAEIMGPFAAFLVPEGTLEHPAPGACIEWRPSLLFPRNAAAMEDAVARVTGRLAGLPAVLDEARIRRPYDDESGNFMGWVVRLDLPFAVGGHLRVFLAEPEVERDMRRHGFERRPDVEARLGGRYRVEVAPPGVTPEDAEGPTFAGVAIDALLTDTLVERMRADGRMQIAATGRTLWVTVPFLRAFDARTCTGSFGPGLGRRAAAGVAAVEAIAREIVRAGTERA
jgi:hypothetical protein